MERGEQLIAQRRRGRIALGIALRVALPKPPALLGVGKVLLHSNVAAPPIGTARNATEVGPDLDRINDVLQALQSRRQEANPARPSRLLPLDAAGSLDELGSRLLERRRIE